MDSLSQLVLGAGVSVAVMGRRTRVWKAALWGGIAGTIPDLDVVLDYGDAISNVTFHRGWSHSLLYLTLLSPALALAASRLHGEADRFRHWWLALWLALFTHPLLDTLTIYGTQLLQPFTDHPYAIGSIFIIDPLFTLPLLLGLIGTGLDRGERRLRWNLAGVVVSVSYLAWTMAAQASVANRARDTLRAAGVPHQARMVVTPTAFNTLLWRVVVLEPDGRAYREGFASLLDPAGPMRFDRFDRGLDLYREVERFWGTRRIAWFSHGFFRMDERDGVATIADLRMGQEPDYVFRFRVAARMSPQWREADRAAVGSRGDAARGLAWLRARLADPAVPPLSSEVPR
jgi:inner membrane protein